MKRRSRDCGYDHPKPSEITPREVCLGRRRLLQTLALGAAGSGLAAWATRQARAAPHPPATGLHPTASALPGARTSEPTTAAREATNYNNFYEFGFEKTDPAAYASAMKTRPWTVTVDGLVTRPRSFDLDELLTLATMEERTYRLRCVEGWSMVIPWVGYSLARLLREIEPLGSAKYVEFTSLADPDTMPNLRSSVIDWPYREGLRLDEARHPLTMLAFGMYGEALPNQNGAPLRLVVPWKYGFKSAKSIVRIRLVEQRPITAWEKTAPREYGFYANVNPEVDHPRWSQATERRLGDGSGLFARRRRTQLFNGYAPQVAELYAGMDLAKFY
ncbi:MAG: protein-methionine-sulfoxide reductase catalytic subunit MsrP [Gammaproteobacteria bacterium]